MPKFVLIDPSVQDFGGHFYEYAMRVLKAAEAEGYSPVLATNRRFEAPEGIGAKVYPVYHYTHFMQRTEPFLMRVLLPIRAWVGQRVFRRMAVLRYSSLGTLWSSRHEPRVLARRAELLSPAVLVPLAIAFYLLKVFRVGLSLGKSLIPFRRYLGEVYHGLGRFCRVVLTPLWLVVRPPDEALRYLASCVKSRAFGRDTLRLFGRLRLQADDIVFIPTMGTEEMMGLLHYFGRDPGSKQVTWHLLFRRSIYGGRVSGVGGQEERLRPIRKALKRFQEKLSGQPVRFWTDTEELSEQYNRLGMAEFGTAPIPIGPDYFKPVSAGFPQQPLLVTYAGDARSEKGYHYLPHIVQDLWADYVRTDRVRFALQSNYSVPLGEPAAVVGRAQLEQFPADKVRLITKVLSSEEYRELVLGSQVILIPYDRESYSARSSGILAEALAAGVPVIVPAGTWTSRQIVGETYRHHSILKETMNTVAACRGEVLTPGRSGAAWVAGGNASRCSCVLDVPSLSTHALLSFSLAANQRRESVEVKIVQTSSSKLCLDSRWHLTEESADHGACSVLTSLKKGVHGLSVAFRHRGGASAVILKDVGVDFLRSPESVSCYPSGAVGLCYTRMEEIPDLLREMVDHYDHYLSTARTFAPKWFGRHNAKRLVRILTDRPLTVYEDPDEVEVASSSCS